MHSVDVSQSPSSVTPVLSRWAHEQNGSGGYAQRHGLSLEITWLHVTNLSMVETSTDPQMWHHFLGVQITTGWQVDCVGLPPTWMGHRFILPAIDIFSGY